MTTPEGASAIAAATALDAALAAARTVNADLLVAQGQDQAKIETLTAKVTDLETQLAALQPKPPPPPPPPPAPSTLFGASLSTLSGETWAKTVSRTEAGLGPIPVLRVYDYAKGPAWLLNQLTTAGLLDGKRKIVASVKKVDAGIDDLIRAVDYITINHEPDQNYDKTGGARVTPAALAPQLQDFRKRIAAADRTGKTKLMLILTGTNYATRLKAYMDAIGPNVVDVLGVDPYASKGTAAQLVGPLLTAAAAYKLPVAVTEIGMTTATPDATVGPFVASLKDLAGKVEFVTWFNQAGNASLGNRLDNVDSLAQAFKALP